MSNYKRNPVTPSSSSASRLSVSDTDCFVLEDDLASSKGPRSNKIFDLNANIKVDKSDELSQAKVETLVPLVKNHTVSRAISGLGSRMRPLSIDLSYRGGFVTTTNTAYTGVIGVNPNLSSEFSSLASLFDELKVTSAQYKFYYFMIPNTSVAPTWAACGAVVYDPTNNGAISSVAQGDIHSQHLTLNLMKGVGLSQGVSVDSNMFQSDWNVLTVRIPKGPHTSSAGTFVGQWISAADTTCNYGWIKHYLEAGGPGTSWSFQYIIRMRCLYRSRS